MITDSPLTGGNGADMNVTGGVSVAGRNGVNTEQGDLLTFDAADADDDADDDDDDDDDDDEQRGRS